MKLFVKGDLDGFFALGLDNLINILLISSFCMGMLGFDPAFFFTTVLPGTAVSLIIGNFFYARQALKLAKKENRTDVCALPYGINLFTTFAFSVLVMLPAQQVALSQGLSKAEADIIAWKAGVIACIGSALIEIVGGLFADKLRKFIPRAALLAAPAMVGLLMIAGDFFFKVMEYPGIGFVTLALIVAAYYGRIKIKGGIPTSAIVLVLGTVLAWALHSGGENPLVPVGSTENAKLGLFLPKIVLDEILGSTAFFSQYLTIILPMGLLNLIGSLQCLESAAAAGDRYSGRSSLIMNGLGTLGAACFGSPYTTTLYFGHPGWKAIGSRAGYSTLNAVFFTILILTGGITYLSYYVPLEAGMAILVWIGATIFIQAFQTVPPKHFPAVAMGLLPVAGGFAAIVARHALAGAEATYSPELLRSVSESRNFALSGVFASDVGFLFTSVIWAAATVGIIERKFRTAAAWFIVAAGLSAAGFIHSFQITSFDIVSPLTPAWPWAFSYAAAAALMLALPYISEPLGDEEPET